MITGMIQQPIIRLTRPKLSRQQRHERDAAHKVSRRTKVARGTARTNRRVMDGLEQQFKESQQPTEESNATQN